MLAKFNLRKFIIFFTIIFISWILITIVNLYLIFALFYKAIALMIFMLLLQMGIVFRLGVIWRKGLVELICATFISALVSQIILAMETYENPFLHVSGMVLFSMAAAAVLALIFFGGNLLGNFLNKKKITKKHV